LTATRAVDLPEQAPDEPPQARSVVLTLTSHAMRLLLLVCAGLLLQIGWVTVWTLSYRLTHGDGFSYQYLTSQTPVWEKLQDALQLANTLAPGFEPPVSIDILVYSLILAFVVASVGYLGGVLLIDLGVAAVKGTLVVVMVWELVYQVTLFLLPGLYTTDIFSYVMYGQISAIYNLNPYIYPPNYFPGNELLNWIHPIWHDQPSVYGPLWTDLAWVFARMIEPLELYQQVLAYKVAMNVVQLVNLGLVWWLLGRLMSSSRARLTAFALFAWNPLMLFDGPGNAHNDVFMVTLLLLGVVPLTFGLKSRNWIAGTFFVGMSALIKYTTGIVGLFYIVPWARMIPSWPKRILWLGATGALITGTTLVLFKPWLDDPRAIQPILTAANGKSWQYSNSAPDIIALHIDNELLHTPSPDVGAEDHFYLYRDLYSTPTTNDTRQNTKNITRLIFVAFLVWECWGLWRFAGRRGRQAYRGSRDREVIDAVLSSSVRAFIVLIVLVLPWVLDWYWMWPLALAALLGWQRMLTKVVVAYTLTCLPIFYLHHYWSWNTPSSLIFLYVVPPLLLPVVGWLYQRLRPSASRQLRVGSMMTAPSMVGE
jgi:alpha-1,6-mannosyltransferase